MTERFVTVHEAGVIRGITVAVLTPEDRPAEYHVHMIYTFEGVSRVGDPIVGNGAEIKAKILAELVFGALESADITWFGAE